MNLIKSTIDCLKEIEHCVMEGIQNYDIIFGKVTIIFI